MDEDKSLQDLGSSQAAEEELEAMLLEGLNSGDPEPIDWDAIRQEALELSKRPPEPGKEG
jgi:hypothetical protein